MAAPKQPQDHKPKAEDVPQAFTFTADGENYHTLKKTTDVIKASFHRKHRNDGDFGYLCAMIEALAQDEETLEAFDQIIDSDDEAQMKKFRDDWDAHFEAVTGGATPGESKAS